MSGLIIGGRQHSGNSVLCEVFDRSPKCYARRFENTWFEHAREIEKIEEVEQRAKAVLDCLPRPETADVAVQQKVVEWARHHPKAHVHEIARRGFNALAQQAGREHWVMMGTSFVFYAENVLPHLPRVKTIYLIRNPYDIAASSYRRVRRTIESEDDLFYGDWLFTPLLGWAKGIQTARSVREQCPDQVRIVRYEDLVSNKEVVSEIFRFAEIPFESRFLDVSHVNKSDPSPSEEKDKGLNTSRVNYFPSVLNSGQVKAVSQLVPSHLAQEYYPDLRDSLNHTTATGFSAVKYHVQCAIRLAARLLRELFQSPAYALERLRRRISVLLS